MYVAYILVLWMSVMSLSEGSLELTEAGALYLSAAY